MSEYKAKHFPQTPWEGMKFPTLVAAGCSLVYAHYDITHLNQCKTVQRALGRLLYYVIPLPGLVAMYMAIRNIARDYRGCDDPLNFYLAAAIVAPVAQRWGSYPTVVMAAMFAAGFEKNYIGYMVGQMKWDDVEWRSKRRLCMHQYRRY